MNCKSSLRIVQRIQLQPYGTIVWALYRKCIEGFKLALLIDQSEICHQCQIYTTLIKPLTQQEHAVLPADNLLSTDNNNQTIEFVVFYNSGSLFLRWL